MAKYQIMYWHDIPLQIKVTDESGTVKQALPARFQQAINSASIARGKYEENAYMNGWRWGARETREGNATIVAQALLNELAETYPPERLRELLIGHAKKKITLA